jgi:hypothetical protein
MTKQGYDLQDMRHGVKGAELIKYVVEFLESGTSIVDTKVDFNK